MALSRIVSGRHTAAMRGAGAAAILNAACVDPDTRPVVAGRWVEVESDPEIEICGGQLELYDQFVDQAPAVFGMALPDDFAVRLHAFTEESRDETPAAGTDHGGRATNSGTEAWVFYGLVDLHELGHAVAIQTLGRSLVSLDEGLAEGLSANRWSPIVGSPTIPLGDLLPREREALRNTGVSEAGKFVRYVVDGYGPGAFRELFHDLAGKTDAVEIRTTTEAVLGDPFAEIATDYETNGRCAYQVPFCSDLFPPQPLPLEIDGPIDCEGTTTLGYRGPDPEHWLPYQVLAFSIEQPTALQYAVRGGTFHLRRCGDCDEQQDIAPATAGPDETESNEGSAFEFPAGRYFVIVEPADPDQEVHFRMYAPP